MDAYDALIIGSGAGGGMSAYVLAKAGLKVLLLEAGRSYDPASETPMFDLPAGAPLLGSATPDKPMGYFDATVDGGWDVPGEPYTVAEGSEFRWWRARMLGGRTNHWNRICLRFGPDDFKGHRRDGLGFDWPIAYPDIEPWYEEVERLIGVTGAAEGIENAPDSAPGILLAPPPPRAAEYFLARGFQSMSIPTAAIRAAVLTEPLGERPACLFATPCRRGCAIGANFQSPTVLLAPALATGNLEIRTDSLVHTVELDASGRASGVTYVDRHTGARHRAEARAVVLAASACETVRILLNSRSARFPKGLGNDSGLLGRFLMDTPAAGALARFPALERLPPRNDDGISTGHIYVPWWGHAAQAKGELDFARGYHIEVNSGRGMPTMDDGLYPQFCAAPFGDPFREELRRRFGTYIYFGGHGEMIPNEDSFCDLDPVATDRWGMPALRFHWKWGEQELRLVAHMCETFRGVVRALGGETLFGAEADPQKAIRPGGQTVHEVGGARMGEVAASSVVNANGQCWSVPNLFLADGSVFASSPHKNPTLTIMALSWRTSANLAAQLATGAL